MDLPSVPANAARAGYARRAEREVPPQLPGACAREIVGRSEAMAQVLDLVARVAASEATVLIGGETGTGKELVARAIHERSARAAGPFVAVDCAAIPPALLESELFGHARGAFTDAKSAHPGLFARACGGTLFLDEIGELPLEMQPKLLRALQERRARPVGGTTEVDYDTRIVAASNRDLEQAVAAGTFREDLFYRLDVVRVVLPPLRARGDDVLLLAQSFIDAFAARSRGGERGQMRLEPTAAERLRAYDWPGNVRELENCIERGVALARAERICVEDLPPKIHARAADRIVVANEDPERMPTLEQVQRRYVTHLLQLLGGNKSRCARVLGINRRSLYRRLACYGL